MRVLVACEFSGRVRDAFRRIGHDAYSCDIIDADPYSDYHIKADCLSVLGKEWDLVIAHPPCTYLAASGARWWSMRAEQQTQAIKFVDSLWRGCERLCIENPVGRLSRIRKPTQIIQPWMFGHGETKATCLWLKNLPKLVPTKIVGGRTPRVHRLPPSPDRGKLRSITYQGIADAMAAQWGSI